MQTTEITSTDRRLSSQAISRWLYFFRKKRLFLPYTLSLYYFFIRRDDHSVFLNSKKSLLLLAGSILLGFLLERVSYNKTLRYLFLILLSLLFFWTVEMCAFAHFTTSSYYFELAGLAALPLILGHFYRPKTFSPVSLFLSVFSILTLWIIQMPYHHLDNITWFILYCGALAWLLSLFYFYQPQVILIFPKLLLVIMLIAAPVRANRYLAVQEVERNRVFNQKGVETLFFAEENSKFPEFTMAMKCNQTTGRLIVTPHGPSNFVSIVDRSGKISQVVIGGESADKSTFIGPLWVTASSGKILFVDTEKSEIVYSYDAQLSKHEVYSLFYHPDVSLLTVAQVKKGITSEQQCLFYKVGGGIVTPINRIISGKMCVPLDSRTILVSQYNRQADLALYNLETDTVIRTAKKRVGINASGPFAGVAVDNRKNLIYMPCMASGIVAVYDLETLDYLSQFKTNPGLRNVLVDPNDPRHVFSWNYATGEVIEHRMPEGEKMRSWLLGPLLRAVNWDCDEKHLLATTSLGGFRIHLD